MNAKELNEILVNLERSPAYQALCHGLRKYQDRLKDAVIRGNTTDVQSAQIEFSFIEKLLGNPRQFLGEEKE